VRLFVAGARRVTALVVRAVNREIDDGAAGRDSASIER
jgi:hypothetical protein